MQHNYKQFEGATLVSVSGIFDEVAGRFKQVVWQLTHQHWRIEGIDVDQDKLSQIRIKDEKDGTYSFFVPGTGGIRINADCFGVTGNYLTGEIRRFLNQEVDLLFKKDANMARFTAKTLSIAA